MAWELLPVDYTNATWSGLKKYNKISNEDGSVSFQDVTIYTGKEKSFFGAKDANRMNEALNTIMSMVESGTDLYTAFQNYFDTQKKEFKETADVIQTELKTDYISEMDSFESQQQGLFSAWFDEMKDQLSEDAAGKLQLEIDTLDAKTDGFDVHSTVFTKDGKSITETMGDKKIITEFTSSTQIIQKLYKNDVLTLTKTIAFSEDGLNITEEVV